jgi:hypothetical protein
MAIWAGSALANDRVAQLYNVLCSEWAAHTSKYANDPEYRKRYDKEQAASERAHKRRIAKENKAKLEEMQMWFDIYAPGTVADLSIHSLPEPACTCSCHDDYDD